MPRGLGHTVSKTRREWRHYSTATTALNN